MLSVTIWLFTDVRSQRRQTHEHNTDSHTHIHIHIPLTRHTQQQQHKELRRQSISTIDTLHVLHADWTLVLGTGIGRVCQAVHFHPLLAQYGLRPALNT